MKALGFQPVESTSLSKLWFQSVNLHPYTEAEYDVEIAVNTGNIDTAAVESALATSGIAVDIAVGMGNRLL